MWVLLKCIHCDYYRWVKVEEFLSLRCPKCGKIGVCVEEFTPKRETDQR
uniref:Uncharacterized protein n=1 Tax=viral metagenome TaxID=1070528 RepID=A0A6H1ZQ45_9ZZZZ